MMLAVWAPLHTTWFWGCRTSPDGLTVIVNDFEGPAQITDPDSKYGVAVMVATTGLNPLLTGINDGMLVVPLAASPMAGVSFTHV